MLRVFILVSEFDDEEKKHSREAQLKETLATLRISAEIIKVEWDHVRREYYQHQQQPHQLTDQLSDVNMHYIDG